MNTLHSISKLMRARSVPETDRLHTLAVIERHHGVVERLTQARCQRVGVRQQIEMLAEGGKVGVIVWSRDCDHVCGESKYVIDATLKAYDAFVERQLDGAEGPMSFRLCRASQPFKGWSRDMVLEAHENGHAHLVRDAHYEDD